MKHMLTSSGLFLTGCFGVACSAIAEPVTVTNPDAMVPVELEAYEPFTLELGYIDAERPAGHFHVDVADQTIEIGHELDPNAVGGWSKIIRTNIQGLAPGTYKVRRLAQPADDLDSSQVVQGEWENAIVVAEAPPTYRVYTLFNEFNNHYFMTASREEAEKALGYGWRIVDPGFNVWPAEGPAPSAAKPVCRFYSQDVDSRFYTADEAECVALKEEQGSWQYEGIAFKALVPVAEACPASTAPVWRLYNNRYMEQDSNHRFVVEGETYRTMVADGWVGEGVAFCSPAASE